MAKLDALLDAVCAAPDDDGPRVAYADAIAATDADRAEFIRLELLTAKARKSGPQTDEVVKAYNRARILSDKHRATWDAQVRPLVTSCGFLRGFVEYVELDASKFLATAPELYRRAPVLHVNFTGAKPVIAELFASPQLARLKSIGLIRNQLDDADIAIVAKSAYLSRLEWLDVSLNAFGQAGLDALAASDRLPKLGYVSMMGNLVDDPTPHICDGYEGTSAAAEALQAKYGPRPWLDAHERAKWPPDRDAVKY